MLASTDNPAPLTTASPLRDAAGAEMFALVRELFPICRSITGDGVRETLFRLQRHIPLQVHEVPSGTPVLDWEIPLEWNIHDAWIRDPAGEKVVDFRQSNLHVVSGSLPVRARLPWRELKARLHTLPDHPDWIPYRTAFHQSAWGFSLTHRRFQQLDRLGDDREYEVCIDSRLEEGSLTFGELLLSGRTDEEVLISTHICHPSLANDGLSGVAVATWLARTVAEWDRRYSYRFVFVPATIGAIAWLALHEHQTHRIRHGLVLSVLGDAGRPTYRRSRRGDAEIDQVAEYVLSRAEGESRILDFEPFGYDQRQYCSPGFDLPMGTLMRTPNGQYPEYHTSADDLSLVQPESLADSLATCVRICEVLEHNQAYLNLKPKGEPRLGRYGLYKAFGTDAGFEQQQRAVLWVLNLADGRHSLLETARRSRLPFDLLHAAAQRLLEHGLLETVPAAGRPAARPSSVDPVAPTIISGSP